MIRSYVVSAVRSLMKNRMYTVINVAGLAFGLALCVTVITYISYEYSWEDGHQRHDRIFRVEATYRHGDTLEMHARVMAPLGDAILGEVPGVEQAAVFRQYSEIKVEVNKEEFPGGQLILARPGFFDVFTVPVRVGDPRVILEQPLKVLVSDSASRAYFPDQNPVGKEIELKSWDGETRFTVEIAGVFEDLPRNTQLHCDFIASYSSLSSIGLDTQSWTNLGGDLTYLLLEADADPLAVAAAVQETADRRLGAELSERYSFRLKPLKDIYFDTYFSGNFGELYPGGEYEIVYLLSAIALFVLIQAIANFINLSTARSADRAREIGVRKTFGAERSQLMKQFLGESLLLAMAAMLVGLPFYELFQYGLHILLPGQGLTSVYGSVSLLLATFALVLITGLLAGFYPAFYLSRFRPVTAIQGQILAKSSRSWLRRGLVLFQFTLALVFILTTIISFRQSSLVMNLDLGFDRDNMLVLRFNGDDASRNCELMREELRACVGVIGATRVNHPLGTRQNSSWGFYPTPDLDREKMILAKRYSVDCDFVSLFDLQVVEGRDFSPDRPEDPNRSILINESMVRDLGLSDPIGYRLYRRDGYWEVIGVLKDFQGSTVDWFHSRMSIVTLTPENSDVLCIKLSGSDLPTTLSAIGRIWDRTVPNQTFSYSFLDEDIRASYRDLSYQVRLFGVLSAVTIAIACMSIFGLISYTAEQKTKEIGIRKVLGASVPRLVIMLAREFLTLIAVANLLAWPGAHLLASDFLQEYAFRVDVGVGTYVSGGLLVAFLALATSGYQSFKAARANPVEALRYE